jgi:hypothetical protein
MPAEIPLQHDMFTGELVDTRTRQQKRRDRARELPQQVAMFDTRTTLELARSKHRHFDLTTQDGRPLALALMMQDPRTEEEVEADRMQAAQAMTVPMFAHSPPGETGQPAPSEAETTLFPSGLKLNTRRDEEASNIALRLYEDMEILLFTTRDAAYEQARNGDWQRGHRCYTVADNQLEVWNREETGYYLITYSDMEMVEDIRWIDEKGGA